MFLKLERFFGLIILIKIIYKPSASMWWATYSLYFTPIFRRLWHTIDFTYFKRFYTSRTSYDSSYDPTDDKIDRCHHDYPFTKMKSYCILEGSCALTNHLVYLNVKHIKEYIKTKSGIQLFKLTSSISITLNFLVNYEKGMFHNDNKNSVMPTIGKISIYLPGPYLDKGHTPCTENFYASP